jgi:hypothetical protein
VNETLTFAIKVVCKSHGKGNFSAGVQGWLVQFQQLRGRVESLLGFGWLACTVDLFFIQDLIVACGSCWSWKNFEWI